MTDGGIDFVITWVDDADPIWREKKAAHMGKRSDELNNDVRYRDWETLKYWFRGVEKFAPWVRNIYFVSDNQKPRWLNIDHPKLKWVKHTDYIPEEYLPTFNSNTIIWNLHRIEGLSENFVFLNDDVFLINKTEPTDFFVDGLPCDYPRIRNACFCGAFTHSVVNNNMLIDRHFSLRSSVKDNAINWLKAQNFRFLLSYLLLGRKSITPVMLDWHIQNSYNKKTFEKLWDKEYKLINETCLNKFRTSGDVTDWCIRYWQLYSNRFSLKKPIGKYFTTASISYSNDAIEYLKKRKGKIICLNDTENETDFESHKKIIINEFEKLFPEKSSFEL